MGDESVTLPRSDYEEMLARIADLEDALAIAQSRATDEGERVPHAVVRLEAEGMHPVRAWRRHRAMSVRTLAAAAGLTPGYLSEIETGKKPGSIAAFRALAKALEAPVDLLIADAGDGEG